MLEQSLQSILMQKQAFQMELAESEAALEEMKVSGEEVFKIIGRLMIKSEKTKVLEELENKKKTISLRLDTLDKQEKSFSEKMNSLREELLKSSSKE